MVNIGHSNSVYKVEYSQDGKLLASLGLDHRVRIWDVEKRKVIRVIIPHGIKINDIAFNADATKLATASVDFSMKVWEVATGKLLQTFNYRGLFSEPYTTPAAICFHPTNPEHIIAGAKDGNMDIWNLTTGEHVKRFPAHSNSVFDIEFDPKLKYIATAGADYITNLWSLKDYSYIRSFIGHGDWIMDIDIDTKGKKLVSASVDSYVKIWDLKTGKTLESFKEKGPVTSVDFHPTKSWLIMGGTDKVLTVFDYVKKVKRNTISTKVGRGFLSILFDPSGERIISTTKENHITFWEPDSTHSDFRLMGVDKPIYNAKFSPTRRQIVVTGDMENILVFDLDSATISRRIKRANVQAIDFHTTKDLFAAGSAVASPTDKLVKVWRGGVRRPTTFQGHKGPVKAVLFSPDGKYLASGGAGKRLNIFDTETGKPVHELKHPRGIKELCFSSDSKHLAVASRSHDIFIWDVEKGQILDTLSGHQGEIESVVYDSQGRFLVSASKDQTIRIWNAQTYTLLNDFRNEYETCKKLCFSPDGNLLLTGSNSGNLGMLNVTTGVVPFNISGHETEITSVNFRPDGKYFISTSLDQTVRIWDTSTGKRVCTLYLFPDTEDWVIITPDRRFDGSLGGLQNLHYVKGMEIIPVNFDTDPQYVPKLLGKLFE